VLRHGLHFTFLLLLVCCSSIVHAAQTFITNQELAVTTLPNGETALIWPAHTVFTGSYLDDYWIEISGRVGASGWQAITPHLYTPRAQHIIVKPKTQGGDTIFYKTFSGGDNKAKTYRVVDDVIAYLAKPDQIQRPEYETWIYSKEFTSAYEDAEFIKATGNVSDHGWQAFDKPRWIRKPAALLDITLPRQYDRAEGVKRVAVVDKEKLYLTLYEVSAQKVERLMTTPVALGYDKCLPKEKGGQCYYTPEGTFEIDFKLFDPSGIQWCVPPKMRGEFKEKLARGENCWRGIMGRHALHFGDSLFLHGTSNPSSIGSKSTHGCVRLRNLDIEQVYRLMEKGDKVIVTSKPDSLNLKVLLFAS
jgi:hypothetical protein